MSLKTIAGQAKAQDFNDNFSYLESQKATKAEVQSMADGSPKGVYSTLAELQTAYPAGNTGAYLVTADGHWYYWNDSVWADGGQYQNAFLERDSVTPEQTRFLSISKNRFNIEEVEYGFFMGANGVAISSTNYDLTGYIPVEEGETIYFSMYYVNAMILKDVRFICAFDAAKNPLSESGIESDTSIYAVPAGVKYIRASIHINNAASDFMIQASATGDISEYEEYKGYSFSDEISFGSSIGENEIQDNAITSSKIQDNAITSSKCDKKILTLENGKNLYNVNTKVVGYFVNWDNGNLQTNASYVASDYIEINEHTTYTQSSSTKAAFYDEDKQFVRGVENLPEQFTSELGEKYIRVSQFALSDLYQLQEGTYIITEDFYYQIPTEINGANVKIASSAFDFYKGSRLYGKKVSWYGTSITQGYAWCEMINNLFGFNATNNGVGGTTVCNESEESSMCHQNRMLGLYSSVYDENTGETTYEGVAIPTDVEVIFIEAGANDWARNWPVGSTAFTDMPDNSTFGGACHEMFDNLTTLFPDAEIIVVGSPFGKMPDRDIFTDKYGLLNNNNMQTIEYGDTMLEIAGKWGIKGINMGRLMQVHDNNIDTIIPDGLHLKTAESQERACATIANYLLSLK